MQTGCWILQAVRESGLGRLSIVYNDHQSTHVFSSRLLLLDLCCTSNSEWGDSVKFFRTMTSTPAWQPLHGLLWATSSSTECHPSICFLPLFFFSLLFLSSIHCWNFLCSSISILLEKSPRHFFICNVMESREVVMRKTCTWCVVLN